MGSLLSATEPAPAAKPAQPPAGRPRAHDSAAAGPLVVRELYVPFEDLNVLLENEPQRVLLPRSEYEALLAKAQAKPQDAPPIGAAILSADYVLTIEAERAQITGRLTIEVLGSALQAVELDVGGVGVRRATLDGKSASIGRGGDGRLTLFIEGKGLHQLELDLVAPLATSAAQQVLDLCVPTPAATRVHLSVPGDVEIKSGMSVISRQFDASARQSRFELLPGRGKASIVMTLNSHLLRRERVVVARSVVVDEVTQNYERLHATFSLAVLHKAVDRFRLALPEGFEVTQVQSPLLSRWSVATEQSGRVLDIRLREATTQTVVINFAAIRTLPPDQAWTFPRIEALDVAGQVSVVGLLLEDRLKAEAVRVDGLIAIDTSILSQALPASVFEAEPGAPPIRPVVAYYAPQVDFQLAARFHRPASRLWVATNLLLTLSEKDQHLRGAFTLLPEQEKLFAVRLAIPDDWHVTSVQAADGKPLPIERFPGRVDIRLPQGVAPRQPCQLSFQATRCPAGWLEDWNSTPVTFPTIKLLDGARETGAIAVAVQDDLTVRPLKLEGLIPLDENEKQRYGLGGVATSLAYRFDAPAWEAGLVMERVAPRLTAQTYSFFVVKPDVLTAHYEIVYDIEQAKARRLELALPASTPETLSIRGLDGVALKEYAVRSDNVIASQPATQPADNYRRWSVLLEEAQAGTVKLAVDFEQPLEEGLAPFRNLRATPAGSKTVRVRLAAREGDSPHLRDARSTRVAEMGTVPLPVIRAEGVAHQAGFVAVEGSAEVDVQVATKLRKVDIGELIRAEYQPGKRLLGTYSFIGPSPNLTVRLARHPGHDLPSVLIERAELVTMLGSHGISQNAARVWLRSKAPYLEINLPAGAMLWSAQLDGVPAKPERQDQRLLINLPLGSECQLHDLQFVYELPVRAGRFRNHVEVPAPTLLLRHSSQAESTPIPVAHLVWHVNVPEGYEVTDTDGTVVTEEAPPPELAAATLGKLLYAISGGFRPFYYLGGLARARTLPARSSRAYRPEMTEAPMASPSMALDGVQEGLTRESGYAQIREHAGRPQAPEAAPVLTQPVPAPPPPRPPAELAKYKASWALEGVRSLKIDLESSGRQVTFHSLGADPRVSITLLNEHRAGALAWGLACATVLGGLRLINRPVRSRIGYVLAVATFTTLIPLVSGSGLMTQLFNPSFLAAACLVPGYLVIGFLRWLVGLLRATPVPAPAAAALLAALVLGFTRSSVAAEPTPPTHLPMVVEITEPHKPVALPKDAIILPYDPTSRTGIADVQKMLVPYEKYLELWIRAHPDQRITTTPPPAPYGLSGVSLRATLQGDEHLLVEADLDIDVFADGTVNVPLPLENGVLVQAELDGRPAKLGVAVATPTSPSTVLSRSRKAGTPPSPEGVLVLNISGKGRHHLLLAARIRLERSGGWRIARGRLLAAPTGTLTLTVPQAQTDVRLAGVSDRLNYSTTAANERIETALSADAPLDIQWRPKISEGAVDGSLMAESTALLDVQEDSIRLVWRVALEFRRGERSSFRLSLPAGYLVTQVAGGNVKGWEISAGGTQQQLKVSLLKPARDGERFDVHLWRSAGLEKDPRILEAPVVTVQDAAMHQGSIFIRRSPLLNVRVESTEGVSRTDLPKAPQSGSTDDFMPATESPLGIRPLAAYKFAAVPFTIQITAAPVPEEITARLQTILRIGERERRLETRVNLDVQGRPLYHFGLLVPGELEVEQLTTAGTYEWTVTPQDSRKLLSIVLTAGQTSTVFVVLSGRLGQVGLAEETPLPRLEVLGVPRQQGEIVVQSDTGFSVDAGDLQECEPILLSRTHGWLQPQQRDIARLALRYRSPAYSGRIRLTPLVPIVHCQTISNARITDRAIQETILLDFTVQQAGIRELSFLLPESLKEAHIKVPQLRQKTIESSPDQPGLIRVCLELQDKVMGQLRVLVEHDRPLTPDIYRVPMPTVEKFQTDRRYVLLESAGRDEIVITTEQGLTPLGRQQKEWEMLAGILGKGITSAYIADPSARTPVLAYQGKDRALVETVGARIALAQCCLSVDDNGTYRAAQIYRLDNSTEQFLEIQLPPGAQLWTANVAGEPAKPTQLAAAKTDHLLIPLVKTAAGDLDYEVVLKYGGRLPTIGRMGSVTIPMIRPVNIDAELSQVCLYLPEKHHWFDFGGTMTRVEDEAGWLAGYLSYQTKRAERLNAAMRGKSDFAKVRAAANLKTLQYEVERFQQTAQTFDWDDRLQHEWVANADAVAGAARQSEEVRKQVVEQGRAEDNRFSLGNFYARQTLEQRGDTVRNAGGNFAVDAPTSQPAVTKGQIFNQSWFYSNKLAGEEKVPATAAGRVVVQSQSGAEQQQARGIPLLAPRTGLWARESAQQMQQQLGYQTFGLGAEQRAARPQAAVPGQSGKSRGKAALGEYYDTLQSQVSRRGETANAASGSTPPQAGDRLAGIQFGAAFAKSGPPQPAPTSGLHGGTAGDAMQPAMPAGLTSLDVELMHAGQVYRFTSPRGEATITVRAVSESFTDTLKRLGLAVVVALAAWLIWKTSKRQPASAMTFAQRAPVRPARMAWTLIAAGIVSVLTGALPVAGLVLIIAGIALRVRNRMPGGRGYAC